MDILIYTRNYTPDGKGYVHDNIATSVAALRELCAEHGLKADASDDPALFTEARYTRHPSQADLHSAFQDHPLAQEHFPTGSLISPPAGLLQATSGVGAGDTAMGEAK